jgi:hypothetical protein
MTSIGARPVPVGPMPLRRARDHVDPRSAEPLDLDAIGFSSLGSFSARFTQLVGETPTAYRDRWAAAGGARVPGCYLFMCGVLDPGVTGGPGVMSS